MTRLVAVTKGPDESDSTFVAVGDSAVSEMWIRWIWRCDQEVGYCEEAVIDGLVS